MPGSTTKRRGCAKPGCTSRINPDDLQIECENCKRVFSTYFALKLPRQSIVRLHRIRCKKVLSGAVTYVVQRPEKP